MVKNHFIINNIFISTLILMSFDYIRYDNDVISKIKCSNENIKYRLKIQNEK